MTGWMARCASAALDILAGLGFHLPAIGPATLFVIAVEVLPKLERRLPASSAYSSALRFRESYLPRVEAVRDYLPGRGLSLPPEIMTLKFILRRSDTTAIAHGHHSFGSRAMALAEGSGGTLGLASEIAAFISPAPEFPAHPPTHGRTRMHAARPHRASDATTQENT